MKTIIAILIFSLYGLTGFSQDTIKAHNPINLAPNNTDIAPTGGAPGGSDQGWGSNAFDTTVVENKFCVDMHRGKTRLELNGKPVKSAVALDDGTIITSNGKVVRKNGDVIQLTAGECIAVNGEINEKSRLP